MREDSFLSIFVAEGAEQMSLVLLVILGVLFVVQLCYYIAVYGRISRYKNPPASEGAQSVGVSVIIPLYDADNGFLHERLPLFLAQRHKNYEVVVVNVTGDQEVAEQLSLMRIKYGERLTTTRLAADPLMPISTKSPYSSI